MQLSYASNDNKQNTSVDGNLHIFIGKHHRFTVLSEDPNHIKFTLECSFQSFAKNENITTDIHIYESVNIPFSETLTTLNSVI